MQKSMGCFVSPIVTDIGGYRSAAILQGRTSVEPLVEVHRMSAVGLSDHATVLNGQSRSPR